MKNRLILALFFSCGWAAAQDALKSSVRETDNAAEPGFKTLEKRTEFSRASDKSFDIGHSFSSALGWVLWKTPNTSLSEVSSLTGVDPDGASREQLEKEGFTFIYGPKGQINEVSLEEYSNWGLKSRLGLHAGGVDGREEGSAILLSLRDSFSYFNANQGGFALDYTSKDGDSSWKAKGALIMDIYLDPLYNREPYFKNSGLPYRFSLRTGIEFDRDDSATDAYNRTSIYLLANFQANPDQKARLFGINRFPQILSPQFVQIGIAYDHDEFSGEDDLRWIFAWQPQFYLMKNVGFLGETLGINRKMIYQRGHFADFLKPSELNKFSTSEASNWYSYIPADLRVSGGSEVWKKVLGTDGGLDAIFLEWKAGFVVGNTASRIRFGYLAEGISPLTDPGNTHVGHSLFAEMGLGNLSQAHAERQKASTEGLRKNGFTATEALDTDLGVMTVFAKYTLGEFAPTFEDHNIFQIGTRIRF